jgi:hypothetical protein
MKLTFSRKSFRFTAILAAPVFLAAVSLPCQARPAAVEAYNWGSPQETSALLKQIRAQADNVKGLADRLNSYNREWPIIGWQIDALMLKRVRWHVNTLDDTLFQLENSEANALPWQKRAIKRIAPMIYELTGATEASINQLNDNHDCLWASNYPSYTNCMYKKANRIAHTVGNFVAYAGDMHNARELRETLGLHMSSGS